MIKRKPLLIATIMLCNAAISTSINSAIADQVETSAPISADRSASSTLWQNAVKTLSAANSANERSRQLILTANTIRKQLTTIRAELRKTEDKIERRQLERQADTLSAQLQETQLQGAQLRNLSQQQISNARSILQQAFNQDWQPWINHNRPLSMDMSTQFIAHNARIRSVHPSMQDSALLSDSAAAASSSTSTNSTSENSASAASSQSITSLALASISKQNAPPDLDISTFQLSREQRYFAHIAVDSEQGTVPLNKIHRWRLLVSDLSGEPVKNAAIAIEGHMPGHVHGLPTEPQITTEIAPGIYQVEGIKFQMKGWWVIQFHISEEPDTETQNSADTLTFNLML